MKSIKEQVAGKCIHFNGIMNKVCKAGVEYDSFGKVKMNVIPCLAGGSAHCDKLQFLSPEELEAKLKEMGAEAIKSLLLLAAAKKHFSTTGNKTDTINCPNGDHQAQYTRANSNGHFWVRCKSCQIIFNE